MSAFSTDDRGGEVIAAVWTFSAVSGAVLGLRIYCKVYRHRGLWWDDYVLAFSWLCLLISTIVTQLEVRLGFGKHIANVDPANLPQIGMLGEIVGFLAILGNLFSKVSFGITMLRITNGWVRVGVWGTIVTMNVFMLLGALFIWIQCTPVQKSWLPDTPGSCWSTVVVGNYNTFAGAYSGVMDILLALLPWTIIPKLQMKTREKFGTAIAMSMGVFAGATAFIKCVTFQALSSGDFTYEGSYLFIWGSCETATTIVATTIPILRALFSQIRSSARSRTAAKGTNVMKSRMQTIKSSSAVVSRPRDKSEDDMSESDSTRGIFTAGENQILRTDEFSMTYNVRQPDEEAAYELGRFDNSKI